MRSKSLHLQGLKRLYAKNRSAQALFRVFSARNDAGDARASVDNVLGWLVAAQQRVPRAELIGILLEHVYRLRRGLTISVKLPPDLTPREAQRLGDFMRTLSFEEGAPPAESS